jgi:RNA polymerase sigma-70 factor (ECF subfamily)
MDHRERPLHVSRSFGPYRVKEVGDARVSVAPDEEFETLYREHALRLWRAVYAYAQDRDVANDAVAEAFAQCLARGGEVRQPDRWIWRAAFRIAAGELKRRRSESAERRDVPYEPSPTNELLDALKVLSPRQRAALVLHYYGGYPTKEIARIVGSIAATVRVHLSQGRKRLRRLLGEERDA